MEFQLVYRILRKISDWAVTGYYSEVLVQGQEHILNVQGGEDGSSFVNGPVILLASHHNEMIDIATLAMTMPQCQGERRHVSFWAKESMFRNPVGGWIMRSSGAIPVKRNPNNADTGDSGKKEKSGRDGNGNGSGSLFASTSHALSLNRVVGVFPEGTSYTQPGIVQVLPGAARAAVEYELWRQNNHQLGKGVLIVPVGIVYTDKSNGILEGTVYSFLCPKILVFFRVLYLDTSFSSSYLDVSKNPAQPSDVANDDSVRVRAAAKAVAARVEAALFDVTVNAPDWETLYAAQIARDIIFEEQGVPADKWVPVFQRLIDLLTASPGSSDSKNRTKATLTRYYALLHHSSLSHTIFSALFPSTASSMTSDSTPLSPGDAVRAQTRKDWRSYHSAILHAHATRFISYAMLKNVGCTLAILPVLPVYVPAFIVSGLCVRFLATPGEEEGEAQFRSIGGGLGLGIGLAAGKVALSSIWNGSEGPVVIGGAISKSGVLIESMRRSLERWVGTLGDRIWSCLPLQMIGWPVEQVPNVFKKLGLDPVPGLILRLLRSRVMASSANKTLKAAGWSLLAWCVVKWYGLFIRRAHKTYMHTLASPARRLWIHHLRTLLRVYPRQSLGSDQINSKYLDDPEILPYLALPPPPTNAFIRKRRTRGDQIGVSSPTEAPASFVFAPSTTVITGQSDSGLRHGLPAGRIQRLSTTKLVGALLCGREEARNFVYSLDGIDDIAKVL
ncbi:hypothetical protein D9757_010913 [Collybiopsis confluens]|uniref:Phospholipid/glycerol acyltransferase domain-containing protein n=1 Tax=Collybiopsis confluens TaxID=2823264 RepID=A0A8H5LQD9_9AGAR|nr:hypothetical protein D9757_010913 [Collybiopsis confluens]